MVQRGEQEADGDTDRFGHIVILPVFAGERAAPPLPENDDEPGRGFKVRLDVVGAERRQQSDIGLDFRFHDILGFSQFTTEADNPVDLAGPLVNRRIPLTAAQRAALVELRPGLFVSPGAQYDLNQDGAGDFLLSDTTDSTAWQLGLFLQQDAQLQPGQVRAGDRASAE